LDPPYDSLCSPRWRLLGDTARDCVASKLRRSNPKKQVGRTADDRAATSDLRVCDPHAYWSHALFICIPPDTPFCCPVQDCARPKQRSHASPPSKQRLRCLYWAPLQPLLRPLRRRRLRPQVGLQVRPHRLHVRLLHVQVRLVGLAELPLRPAPRL